MKSKGRNEKKFVSEVVNSFIDRGVMAYKIPDLPIFFGSKMRFAPKKPFDIVVDCSGRFVAIECKFKNGYQAFGLRDFVKKDKSGKEVNNQIKNLLNHERSYIFLNVFIPRQVNSLYIIGQKWMRRILKGESIKALDLKEMHVFEEENVIEGCNNGYYLSKFILGILK